MDNPLRPSDVMARLGPGSGWWVAYSGGCDSRVLLEIVARARDRLPGRVQAIHVDHGLNADSRAWADHCRDVCRNLNVPLRVEQVTVPPGAGMETMAREARYDAFRRVVAAGEVLLTAHHRDDQAETVVLRACRGTGVTGLAGIPHERPLGAGHVRRPMLHLSRQAIRDWARERRLVWIDDPSNAETEADRNFLRHMVFPDLEDRWPGLAERLCSLASDASETSDLLDALAALDGADDQAWLDTATVRELSAARQRNVLRRWIRMRGMLPPGRRRLDAGVAMLMDAGRDRQPELVWPGGRLRRYRGRLFLDDGMDPPPPTPCRWRGERTMALAGGTLSLRRGEGGLDPDRIPPEGFLVDFRVPGERCRPRGRPARPLKDLFQEAGVPPWLRSHWPILRAEGSVAAVPGVCICEQWAVRPGKQGVIPVWEPR